MSDFRVLELRHRRGLPASGPSVEPSIEVSRFYFSNAVAADASPDFDAGWAHTNSRFKLLASKASETISVIPIEDGGVEPIGQWVSDPLIAQTLTGSVKCYMQGRDPDGGGNVFSRLIAKVVSGDGSTVRGTLLALGNHGGSALVPTVTNRIFADGDNLSEVECQSGDRLVIEMGAINPGFASVLILTGADGVEVDLPENETETGLLNPWIEFSNPILVAA